MESNWSRIARYTVRKIVKTPEGSTPVAYGWKDSKLCVWMRIPADLTLPKTEWHKFKVVATGTAFDAARYQSINTALDPNTGIVLTALYAGIATEGDKLLYEEIQAKAQERANEAAAEAGETDEDKVH